MSSAVLRWTGTATAVSSVAHGAEALGNVRYLRRERILTPDGEILDIPVISGNSWRGLLRRTAADLWWEAVGRPQMTMPVAHAIWAGGALAKSRGTPLTGPRLTAARAACPVIGLFGAAGGGRILDGCVQVGKLLPRTRETAHLIPGADPDALPSMWDITQIEYYSQVPTGAPSPASTPVDSDGPAPARFGAETFLTGTTFDLWLTATWATPAEAALLAETLRVYTGDAHIGGMSRAGHGRLALDLTGPDLDPVDWRVGLPTGAALASTLAWLD